MSLTSIDSQIRSMQTSINGLSSQVALKQGEIRELERAISEISSLQGDYEESRKHWQDIDLTAKTWKGSLRMNLRLSVMVSWQRVFGMCLMAKCSGCWMHWSRRRVCLLLKSMHVRCKWQRSRAHWSGCVPIGRRSCSHE